MKRIGTLALSAGAMAIGGGASYGATLVFNSVNATTFNDTHITQQNGNNAAYFGDDVHLAAPCPQIANISIDFGFFTYDPAIYTPILQVDLFAVDSSGLPVDSNTNDTLSYTPIASAFNSGATFTGSNYNNGGNTSSTHQTVSFDFTGQTGAANLQDFAFAYRDINPAGAVSPGFGFSVFTNPNAPTLGSSNRGYLNASPNDLGATSFAAVTTANGSPADSIDASITCVPEPASLGILALGGLMGMRRRKA